MAYNYKPLDLTDFSGGMVDDYINADPKQCHKAFNVYALNNKTMRTRFGTLLDSLVDAQIPSLTPLVGQRINSLINYNNDSILFVQSAQNIYYRNPVNYATLLGPPTIVPLPLVAAEVPFITATDQTHVAHTQWNRHAILTPDNFDKPIKIYVDDLGVTQLCTAGFPKLAASPTLAESFSYAAGAFYTPSAVTDLCLQVGHGYITGLKVHITAGLGLLPAPLVAGDYYVIFVDVNNFRLATTSANALSGVYIDFTNTGGIYPHPITPILESGAYVYSFCYKYPYKVYSEEFVDLGPTTLVQILNVYSPDLNTIKIENIPVLANAAGDKYDVNNIKTQIYRTINGGQEFYLVAEVPNGTTIYNDALSDSALQDNEIIYTSGGVPDNDAPPLAKYCHSVNGFTYYGYTKDASGIQPSTVKQSQGLDPDSVPASFADILEDDVAGISSVQDTPIVGCSKHIYRIEGNFDELGRGGMNHRRISDHAGCLSHDSFVLAEGALYWFGRDGIYRTEGFQCTKVTNQLNKSYASFKTSLVDKTRKIKGVFDPVERFIYWTISQNNKTSGQEECDAIWALDLNWGVSSEMTSTIWNGFSTFAPTSLVIWKDQLHRADKTGYVLKFTETAATDPKIVAGTPVAGWYFETIIWVYQTIATNFGSSFNRKIANKIALSVITKTNFSIAIEAINDEGIITRDLKSIRYRKNFLWGDEDFV